MTNIISRCHICGKFFDSKKELKDHKDKNHRIAGSEITSAEITTNQAADNNNNN
jgi:hypothetical protein